MTALKVTFHRGYHYERNRYTLSNNRVLEQNVIPFHQNFKPPLGHGRRWDKSESTAFIRKN